MGTRAISSSQRGQEEEVRIRFTAKCLQCLAHGRLGLVTLCHSVWNTLLLHLWSYPFFQFQLLLLEASLIPNQAQADFELFILLFSTLNFWVNSPHPFHNNGGALVGAS